MAVYSFLMIPTWKQVDGLNAVFQFLSNVETIGKEDTFSIHYHGGNYKKERPNKRKKIIFLESFYKKLDLEKVIKVITNDC